MAWDRFFTRGKEFATRQSKWDALFIGIRSMGRDEGLIDYILSVLMNLLFNFTIGMITTVMSFIWGLWGLIMVNVGHGHALYLQVLINAQLYEKKKRKKNLLSSHSFNPNPLPYALSQSYKAPLYQALVFFGLASIAAVSFALSWLIGIPCFQNPIPFELLYIWHQFSAFGLHHNTMFKFQNTLIILIASIL